METIYLLQNREIIRLNENTYKIGRTKRNIMIRFSEYKKGSKLLYFVHTANSVFVKTKLIEYLKTKVRKLYDRNSNKFLRESTKSNHRVGRCICRTGKNF